VTSRRLAIEVPPGEPVAVFRRFVDAPPGLVFAVWTEPEHLRNWWGPRQFELVVCESDPRIRLSLLRGPRLLCTSRHGGWAA
jgi:uncharacterized protein YndB with AHSA1/START domain